MPGLCLAVKPLSCSSFPGTFAYPVVEKNWMNLFNIKFGIGVPVNEKYYFIFKQGEQSSCCLILIMTRINFAFCYFLGKVTKNSKPCES